ncbi:MAG: DUF4139 domain-containing protein [Thermodesulfovibrionales bacterium]
MKPLRAFAALAAIALFFVCLHAPLAGAEVIISEVDDRTALELTVYAQGLGLVREERAVQVEAGTHELRWSGAAARTLAGSARVRAVPPAGGIAFLEQSFRYDPITPKALMDAHIARRVFVVSRDPSTGKEERTAATLLSNEAEPVFEIGGEVTFGVEGRVVFPSIPADLFPSPTFVLLVENSRPGARRLEALYLTEGLGWSADYTLLLDEGAGTADLDCRATVDNQSGAEFGGASLTLVAGDIQRAEGPQPRAMAMAEGRRAAEGFREEALFEYHAYSLDRKVELRDGEAKQLVLLSAEAVPVKTEYVFESRPVYFAPVGPSPEEARHASVFVEARNAPEAGLGVPLPAGVVRIYRRGPQGGLAFVGEDFMPHLPAGSTMRLKAGEAFDLTGNRLQTSFTVLGKDAYEASFRITLRSAKGEDAAVKVVEDIPGDWEMVRSTLTYEKISAGRAAFHVRVPAGGEAALEYTVRVRH